MPLDRDNTSPIYRLGRVWALAHSYVHDDFPASALDVALARPLDGFALLQREINAKVRGGKAEELAEGITQILDGVSDLPTGPLKIESQGPFWIGYYHQVHGMRVWMHTDELRAAGEAMYGEQWQSDLARALGVSSRRVREWIERDAPPRWVRAEIYALLMAKSRETAALATTLISRLPDQISESGPTPDGPDGEADA